MNQRLLAYGYLTKGVRYMTDERTLQERWERNKVAVGMEQSGRRRKELLTESFNIAMEMEKVGWFRLPRERDEA